MNSQLNPGKGTPILSARGITRSFSGFTAVKSVDIDIYPNTIHTVIGPNGAGKSTLFNLLTRFLDSNAGQIHYKGREITHTPPSQLARDGVVRSFQISAIFPRLTVAENIYIPLQRVAGMSTKFWKSSNSLSDLDDQVHALLKRVGLTNLAGTQAGELSYGRKRILELATTLALDPEVILLDEPMAGLGIEDVSHVTDLIEEVAGNRTVVMVEHNLKVVERLSDAVTVMCRGEVLVEGVYADVSADPRVLEAYIGH